MRPTATILGAWLVIVAWGDVHAVQPPAGTHPAETSPMQTAPSEPMPAASRPVAAPPAKSPAKSTPHTALSAVLACFALALILLIVCFPSRRIRRQE